MTTLEKAARAICAAVRGAECGARPFHPYGQEPHARIKSCGCGNWAEHENAATAAISSALLDPSDEVLDEGCRAYWGDYPVLDWRRNLGDRLSLPWHNRQRRGGGCGVFSLGFRRSFSACSGKNPRSSKAFSESTSGSLGEASYTSGFRPW